MLKARSWSLWPAGCPVSISFPLGNSHPSMFQSESHCHGWEMVTSPKHDQSFSLPWELWRNRIGSGESPTAKLNVAKPLTAAMVDNIRIPSLFISVRPPKSRQGNSPYPWDFPPTQRRSFSQSVYTPHSANTLWAAAPDPGSFSFSLFLLLLVGPLTQDSLCLHIPEW